MVMAVLGCPGQGRQPSLGHLLPLSTPGMKGSVCTQSVCSHAHMPGILVFLGR